MLPNVQVTLSGWGYTEDRGDPSDILLYLETTLIAQSQCENSYSDIGNTQFCAGKSGQDSCQVD